MIAFDVAPSTVTYNPRKHGARCNICPLAKEPVVPPEKARGNLRLVIVGEGPGRVEVRWKKPFIGPSGQLLDRFLHENDFPRADAHVTNSALCRGESDKDNDIAAACCAPRLHRELAALPANIPILALGKSAARSVLGVRSILLARGFVWTAKSIEDNAIAAAYRNAAKAKGVDNSTGWPKAALQKLKAQILEGRAQLAGRTVLPSIHPAFVMRADTWRPVLAVDMARAIRVAKGLPIKLLDRGPYKVAGTAEELELALSNVGPFVSCDVETDGLKTRETRMRCLGVSDGRRTVVAHPAFRRGEARGVVQKWPRELSRVLEAFLKTRKGVVFHNGYNFDHLVMRNHGIDIRKAHVEDTLIAHHTYASHLPQRLDQVVGEYVDSGPWKISFGRKGAEEKGLPPHKMPPSELVMYNAADCRLGVAVWHRMQTDLSSERAIYDHDKRLSEICREMQWEGIRMDPERRAEIVKKMKFRSAALKGRMRVLVKNPNFSPARLSDVRRALFVRFRAPCLNPTASGLPSTSSATLEALKVSQTKAGRLALLLLKWRAVVKVKATYLDAIDIHPKTGRVHYNWRPYGTVSGRWSCRFQSAPRWSKKIEDRVRECYIPADGCEFVYFDLSQSEMRAAAYLSGDETFIKTCESGDVHAANASILFPGAAERGWLLVDLACVKCVGGDKKAPCSCSCKDEARGKPFRDVAKNAGFGILYSAEIETIYQFLLSKGYGPGSAVPVTLRTVEAMFAKVHATYRRYYQYCEENLQFCRANGFQRTALLGRIRWIGWFPKPGDVYNFKVQSFIADLMNLRLIELIDRLAAERLTRKVRVVAQIHDALLIETPRGQAVLRTKEIIREIWARSVFIPESGRSMVMPIDLKVGYRMSDFG